MTFKQHTIGQLVWPIFIFVSLIFSGCATDPSIQSLHQVLDPGIPQKVELTRVPFYEQELFQCGPASLAMILNHRNKPVSAEELRPLIYIPDRGGTLQSEIRSVVRQYGVMTLQLQNGLEGLIEEIAAGNPVLVMQNLGLKYLPQWHYAVVIGYDLNAKELILRSGRNERHINQFRVFMNTWNRSNQWGVIIPSRESLPQNSDFEDFITQASALEKNSQRDSLPYYKLGTERWSQESLVWFGLGNGYYYNHQIEQAEQAFRKAIALEPTASWNWNNLAHVLKERGCINNSTMAQACADKLEKNTQTDLEKHQSEIGICKPLPLCPE